MVPAQCMDNNPLFNFIYETRFVFYLLNDNFLG